jgi:hypothetical protein
MSGSANTSERNTQTMMAYCPASLADGSTMLSICIQDILQVGGTWPPVGMKITSGHSASPATSSTKDSSGFLEKILTASSPAELRRLCDERSKQENTQRLSSMTSPNTTAKPGKNWQPIKGLSKGAATQVHRLRKERHKLFYWFLDNQGNQANHSWAYHSRKERLQAINFELTELTGLPQYSK